MGHLRESLPGNLKSYRKEKCEESKNMKLKLY